MWLDPSGDAADLWSVPGERATKPGLDMVQDQDHARTDIREPGEQGIDAKCRNNKRFCSLQIVSTISRCHYERLKLNPQTHYVHSGSNRVAMSWDHSPVRLHPSVLLN